MAMPENGAAGGLCDLHLPAVTGGRERTASEYVALLDRAGFVHGGLRRLPGRPVAMRRKGCADKGSNYPMKPAWE